MLKESRKLIVDQIMKKHNFLNYEVKCLSECPIKSRRKNNSSWCDYHENDTTIIYLKENETDELEDVIVAAHEAYHAINYRDGKTDFKKFILWKNIRHAAFIIEVILSVLLVILAIVMHLNLYIAILFNIYVYIATICINRYFKLYILDENNADILAKDEIYFLCAGYQINKYDIEQRIKERIDDASKSRRDALLLSLFFPTIFTNPALIVNFLYF